MEQESHTDAAPPHILLPYGKKLLGRLTLATVAAFVCLFLFARFSAEFPENGGKVQLVDRAVLAWCHSHQYPVVHQIAYGTSWISQPWMQGGVALLIVIAFRYRGKFQPAGVSLLLGAVGGGVLVAALKVLFHRPRPLEIFAPLGYSFPSGHTFMATVVYGITTYWVAHSLPPRRRPWVWGIGTAAIILVGWSRIYLGEHFPSDVAAGYCAAIFWNWFTLAAVPVLFRKHSE